MYICYDVKGGVRYAKICRSERVSGTSLVSLSRVIDENAGIYQNRKRGVFTYNIVTDTYGTPDPSIPVIKRKNTMEKLILDFGDSFFLDHYITRIGLKAAIEAMKYGNDDSVKALLLLYVFAIWQMTTQLNGSMELRESVVPGSELGEPAYRPIAIKKILPSHNTRQ